MRRADNLNTFMCRLSLNMGASTAWNPQRFFYLYILRTWHAYTTVHCTEAGTDGLTFWRTAYPASDSVVTLCGDATARPFVSKEAHRAGTSISQRAHLSSLLTAFILVENEKVANSHSKKKGSNSFIKCANNRISTASGSGSRSCMYWQTRHF